MDLDLATTARYQPAIKVPKATSDKSAAMEQAKDFEAVFISEAVKTMFRDVPVDPLNGDSNANQSWREMLVDHYAAAIEQRGGFGLAAPIARQLLSIQEANG